MININKSISISFNIVNEYKSKKQKLTINRKCNFK